MQFRDLKKQYEVLKAEIDAQISETIQNGQFILGSKVAQLEADLAEYAQTKYCVSCANGTDALTLPLMAWGVGVGDAVFTSDFTFFASAGAAAIVGATPVLVDIDRPTFNICPNALEAAIIRTLDQGKLTPKAIIPVDLFGLPANYPETQRIAKKYNLLILEDGAQGFGGAIGERRVCSFGDAATTSFFPAKPLGCYGDGGAIFTNDEQLSIILRSLRTQGSSPADKYDNQRIGMNSRLDTLQAAILTPKLRAFIDYEVDNVNVAAGLYTQQLSRIVETPHIPDGYLSSWAQYTIMLKTGEQRDALWAALKEQGIPSMIYYPRGLHQQTAFSRMKLGDELFPNTINASKTVLSLPMHPYITQDEVLAVCDAIKAFME